MRQEKLRSAASREEGARDRGGQWGLHLRLSSGLSSDHTFATLPGPFGQAEPAAPLALPLGRVLSWAGGTEDQDLASTQREMGSQVPMKTCVWLLLSMSTVTTLDTTQDLTRLLDKWPMMCVL